MGPYAYVINLPHDYGISSSFNIEDLVVYKSLTAIPDTPFDEPLFDSIDAPIPMGGVTLCLGGSIEPLDLNYFFFNFIYIIFFSSIIYPEDMFVHSDLNFAHPNHILAKPKIKQQH